MHVCAARVGTHAFSPDRSWPSACTFSDCSRSRPCKFMVPVRCSCLGHPDCSVRHYMLACTLRSLHTMSDMDACMRCWCKHHTRECLSYAPLVSSTLPRAHLVQTARRLQYLPRTPCDKKACTGCHRQMCARTGYMPACTCCKMSCMAGAWR
jgi:hypothetical protein